MTEQPTALRLADELADWSEGPGTAVVLDQAAAELRRLVAQRDALIRFHASPKPFSSASGSLRRTKMTDLRTAAQQALEALEECLYATTDKSQFLAFEAITALKAALAEPVQEPVAWHYTNNGGGNVMHWGPSARLDADIQAAKDYPRVHKVTPLYATPPQRPAEPVRGPVAGAAKSVHDKVYSEVALSDAYQQGWNHAMLRRSLGPHGIKEGT